MLSAANEYEVLQLLLGECRERLAAYAGARHPPPVPVWRSIRRHLHVDIAC